MYHTYSLTTLAKFETNNARAKRFPSQILKTVMLKRKEAEIDNLTKLVAAPRFLKLL